MSTEINELATALSKAQAAIKGAVEDANNPFFQSKYANLASVWEACRDQLTTNGIAVVQSPSADGNKVTVTTVLTHSSGQWMCGELTVQAAKSDPQGIGSAITYARRYSLAAMAGVAPASDDDDGNASSTQGNKKPEPQRAQNGKPKPAKTEPTVPEGYNDVIKSLKEMGCKTAEDYAAAVSFVTEGSLTDPAVLKTDAAAVSSLKLAITQKAKKHGGLDKIMSTRVEAPTQSF